jgi:hypothetical protein
MHDCEAVHRLLLDCGFRDAPWPPRGPRRWSVIGVVEGFQIVVACVADGSGFHLRVLSESAREWLSDVLEQNGANEVAVRAGPDAETSQARGPWLARLLSIAIPSGLLVVGIGAVALFAWSLIN